MGAFSHTLNIEDKMSPLKVNRVAAKGHEKKKQDTFLPLLSPLLFIITGDNLKLPLLTVAAIDGKFYYEFLFTIFIKLL